MLDNKKGAEAPFFNSLKLLVHYVHSNFKAKTHFSSSWFSPHSNSPKYYCFALSDDIAYVCILRAYKNLALPVVIKDA